MTSRKSVFLDCGTLLVTYSGESGATVGVQFNQVEQASATTIFSLCASAMGECKGRLVSSATTGDTLDYSPGGGGNMEKRIAVLESEVSHIKSDVSDIKTDVKKIQENISNINKDMAVALQKLIDIGNNLSEKPNTSEMKAAIASSINKQIIWTVGLAIAILGLIKFTS